MVWFPDAMIFPTLLEIPSMRKKKINKILVISKDQNATIAGRLDI